MGLENNVPGQESELDQEVEQSIVDLGPEVKEFDEEIQELERKRRENGDTFFRLFGEYKQYSSSDPIEAQRVKEEMDNTLKEMAQIETDLEEKTKQYIKAVEEKHHELGMDK